MNRKIENATEAVKETKDATGIRLPGFLNDDDVGLGDVLKEVTGALGIRPCGDCERRAARLNRWVIFEGKRPK